MNEKLKKLMSSVSTTHINSNDLYQGCQTHYIWRASSDIQSLGAGHIQQNLPKFKNEDN
jgi:hypothetical protein